MALFPRGIGALGLAIAVACAAPGCGDAPPQTTVSDATATPAKSVVLQLGPDVPEPVRDRFTELFTGRVSTLRVASPDEDVAGDADTLVVAVGETKSTRRVIPIEERKAEGVIVRQGMIGDAHLVAADGGAMPGASVNLGLGYAAYTLLSSVGFGFLHPLAPTLPARVTLPAAADESSAPRWPVRGIQIHTMHPLELTDLLEGWGPNGPNDARGWEAMLPEWSRFCEWAVANRLNRVQWVLLHAASWADFSESDVRRDRLKRLVDEAHRWGLTVGLDVPISQQQQHAFALIREIGDPRKEVEQLSRRVDWVMSAGFDYLSTVSGQSEFTHADPRKMLFWMNELVKRVEDVHHRHAFIKVHASTGQTADGFNDPRDGKPLNINFLPHFADPRLGIMPHTVQHYGVDDPAPTYGNSSFRPIYDFMSFEAGRRPVLWHPETAYWVSFDIDVPLFLPVYAERRVSDLRLIARDASARRIDGQMIFSSGWEWGYWLNDVVAARASYEPESDAPSDLEATQRILAKALPFGTATKDVVDVVARTARDQKDLLIDGKVDGRSPRDLRLRNGQAYLQGFETWDEISALAERIGIKGAQMTQPNRAALQPSFFTMGPDYGSEIAPLLGEMEARHAARRAELDRLRPSIPDSARDLFDDLADALAMTALRARQIHALYDRAYFGDSNRLVAARGALDEAARIVAGRERRYRVPAARIAAWRKNPTAYEFTYLWTVHSLFFWWRDEGKVTERPFSPCYKNFIDPIDIAIGEGIPTTFGALLRDVTQNTFIAGLTECFDAPAREPIDAFSHIRR
jgi:hypothetical protein